MWFKPVSHILGWPRLRRLKFARIFHWTMTYGRNRITFETICLFVVPETWKLLQKIIGYTPPHNSQTFVLSISILNVDPFLNKSKWINSQCFTTRSCCWLLENVCSKLERLSKLSHACKFERVSFPTKNKREWIYLEKLMAMCLFSFLLRPVTGFLSSGFWKVLSKFQVDGNWWKSMKNIAVPHRSLGNKIAGFRRFKWIESDLGKLL